METTRPSLLLRIRDAQDGDSWATFHAIYRPLLLRFARGRGVGPEDAEDITQQVLAEVHAGIGSFDYDRRLGGFKAWLRTLVLHRVGSLFRHRDVRRKGADRLEEREARRDRGMPSPEESFERIWTEEHLWHVMQELERELEPQTLAIYRALVFEDQAVAEIASREGVSAQNIYTIKWRVSRRIQERWQDLTGEARDG